MERTSSTTELAEPKKIMPCRWMMSTDAPYCSRMSCSATVRPTFDRSRSGVAHWSTPECDVLDDEDEDGEGHPEDHGVEHAERAGDADVEDDEHELARLQVAVRRAQVVEEQVRPKADEEGGEGRLGHERDDGQPARRVEPTTTMTGRRKDRAPMPCATIIPRYVTVGTIIDGAAASCDHPACRISWL